MPLTNLPDVKAPVLIFLVPFFVTLYSIAFGSTEDTLVISQKEAEALFLHGNLDLVAQKLAIQQAEAQIIQARLWPNPEFSLDEVNLWATKTQLSSEERIPPLFGNFGRNREFTAELSQLIETGGKRKKRVALAAVSRDIATEYFAELIRELKTQLRKNLFELYFQQSYLSVLSTQQEALDKMLIPLEKQYDQGNINKLELIRLKGLRLDLNQQIVEVQKEVHAAQKQLSVLLNIPGDKYLVAALPERPEMTTITALSLENLLSAALANRPDGKISALTQTWSQREYDYEYALRKPDLTLGMNYDRGGNFLLNFFGFGLKVDVPVFHRNQGRILESKIGIERAAVEARQKNYLIEAEVTNAFRDLQKSLAAYQNLDAAFEPDLDQVFQAYTQYFLKRQINLVEYLNFFDAYISNKRTILITYKQLWDSWQEVSFATATELQ